MATDGDAAGAAGQALAIAGGPVRDGPALAALPRRLMRTPRLRLMRRLADPDSGGQMGGMFEQWCHAPRIGADLALFEGTYSGHCVPPVVKWPARSEAISPARPIQVK